MQYLNLHRNADLNRMAFTQGGKKQDENND